jgi:hypothetical protein
MLAAPSISSKLPVDELAKERVTVCAEELNVPDPISQSVPCSRTKRIVSPFNEVGID